MKIAILTPIKFDDAETFIQNHITSLPFDSIVIHGGVFPHLLETNMPTTFQRQGFKFVNKFKKKLGFKGETFQEYNLSKILKKEKVDLVFAEYLITAAETVEVCKKLNIPIIAIALGYEISMYPILKKYEEKYRNLFLYAKNILIVSKHMRKNIEAFGCNSEKIIFTPAGPDSDFFKITPTFETKQIAAVGRFVDKKAPHLTILAFKKVIEVFPEATLVMAGDGPLWNACKDLVKAYRLEKSILFMGRINRKEHQELLENSYLFIQHSKIADNGDSEGTPVAILEASAAGLPIIATHHAGIPDVVINNKTGFLSKEQDVDAMAENIMTLLKNKFLAIKMGVEGTKYVQENFSLEQHIQVLQKVLEAAVLKK